MVACLRLYLAYGDSVVELLGKVPEHWEASWRPLTDILRETEQPKLMKSARARRAYPTVTLHDTPFPRYRKQGQRHPSAFAGSSKTMEEMETAAFQRMGGSRGSVLRV